MITAAPLSRVIAAACDVRAETVDLSPVLPAATLPLAEKCEAVRAATTLLPAAPGAQEKEALLHAYRAARIGSAGGYLAAKTRDGFFTDPTMLAQCQEILGLQEGNVFCVVTAIFTINCTLKIKRVTAGGHFFSQIASPIPSVTNIIHSPITMLTDEFLHR